MRRCTAVSAAAASLVISVACGSTTMTSVTPTPVRCDVSVAPPSGAVSAGGGTGSISISTEAECAWNVSADVSWISQLSPQSGLGSAEVGFFVASNAGPPRSATLTVEQQTVIVHQASGCSYALAPASRSIGSGGGASTTSVSTTGGCPWTATSHVSWITIASGESGTGNGIVRFTVAANMTPARTGTLTVGGETLTVSQGSGCTYTVQPGALSIGAAGGPLGASVSAGPGCTWTAESRVPWITLTSGGSSAGSAEARFTAAANVGPQRSGTVDVAGRSITVTQASGCTYIVSPLALEFGIFGTGRVTVTTAPGCPWTATPSASWIVILEGRSGVGNGSVDFGITLFFGTRTGTLTLGGQSVVIRQNVN